MAIQGQEAKGSSLPVKNDPPRIVFAASPTVLVSIDGSPVWRTVETTRIERVLNTRPLLLKDLDGRIYLHMYDGWLTAATLEGPWGVAPAQPAGFVAALEKLKEQDAPVGAAAGPAQKASLKTGPVPAVLVAAIPT